VDAATHADVTDVIVEENRWFATVGTNSSTACRRGSRPRSAP
jgi:hypothetical protein